MNFKLNKLKKVAVTIFIHDDNPSYLELISLKQVYKILDQHPIFVVCPEDLKTDLYDEVINGINYVIIPKHWQKSIQSYNNLKLSRFLYRIFKEYEFLLTYELDAFVFKDELLKWCDYQYDYVGAPWFKGYSNPTLPNEFIGVGNSGFSLRKVSAMRKMLRKNYLPKPFKGRSLLLEFKAFGLYCVGLIRNLGLENYSIQKYNSSAEDMFIYQYSKNYNISIPSPEVALKFSFEVNPSILYSMNGEELPFGCHAWNRYEPEFWKPILKDFGYIID
jgi:hypothetical protein